MPVDSMPFARFASRPREECGVCAVVGHPEASKLAYLALLALQHRGQEATGIVSAWRQPSGQVHQFARRGQGLVSEVFGIDSLAPLRGDVAIGHVRYSTTGGSGLQNVQPVMSSLRHGQVALGHNGNLTNATQLRTALQARGALFQSTIDSEVILHLMSRAGATSVEGCLLEALREIDGAYSLVVLHEEDVYVVRDPRGFRPLVLGRLPSGGWVAASETCALELVGADFARDVDPGEVVRLRPGAEPRELPRLAPRPEARCIFELVYFARADSAIDGRDVAQARLELGAQLWRECPADVDTVIGVPDSSLPAAVGYAREGRLPYDIGLVTNHAVGRTFIMPSQGTRDFGARVKYSAIRSAIAGRRVAVVDDSIVRGTTARKIVAILKDAGAREVHLRISAPPWRHPCLYGIDTPDPADFVATGRTIADIQSSLGVDSLGYLSPAGLAHAVGKPDGWCSACFTGSYPTPAEGTR